MFNVLVFFGMDHLLGMFKTIVSWFLSIFVKIEAKPSESYFYKLADEDPEKLELYIRKNYLEPSLLTYALEILGEKCNYKIADRTILPMLWHESPIVREGAIYGLKNFRKEKTVVECLESIAKADPNLCVRQIARDLLEEDF